MYIGDNVRVGAGSVVLKNLPAIPPRSVFRPKWSACAAANPAGGRPGPAGAADVLSNRISALEARLSRMEAAMQGEYPPDKPRFAAPETDGVPPQDPHIEE